MKNVNQLLNEILAARQEQAEKGYDTENDDGHFTGELAVAAGAYALAGCSVDDRSRALGRAMWPEEWPDGTYKPRLYRDNLIRSAALLLAELERLERLRADLKFFWVGEPTEVYFAWDENALMQHLRAQGVVTDSKNLPKIVDVPGHRTFEMDGQQVTLEDLALDFLAARGTSAVAGHQILSGYSE